MGKECKVNDSLIAFVDILGYSKIIEDCNNDEKLLNEKLNYLIGNIEISSLYIKENQLEQPGKVLKTLSDCFVICWDINSPDIEIGETLTDLIDFQCSLALNGIFLRGGISISKNYFDKNIIFGSGMLTSYRLESKEAIYPRIILDENSLNSVIQSIQNTRISGYEDNEIYLAKYILKDQDDKYFVNYLAYSQKATYSHNYEENSNQMLHKHKIEIEKKLDKFQNNSKILNKYEWLASYHNYFVIKYFPEKKDLIIEGYERKFEQGF